MLPLRGAPPPLPRSPQTNLPLASCALTPNHALRQAIEEATNSAAADAALAASSGAAAPTPEAGRAAKKPRLGAVVGAK